jgi:hypothetical protein
MTIHELKTWPKYFAEIKRGMKKFELRKDDRDFKVGDWLDLREYDPAAKKYTGRGVMVYVWSVLRNAPEFGLMDGFVILSIQPLERITDHY